MHDHGFISIIILVASSSFISRITGVKLQQLIKRVVGGGRGEGVQVGGRGRGSSSSSSEERRSPGLAC
jgi:hypothetical protein